MQPTTRYTTLALLSAVSFGLHAQTIAQASDPPAPRPAPPRSVRAAAPQPAAAARACTSVTTDAPLRLALGKSQVIHLDQPASRIVVGGQASSRAGRPIAMPPAGAASGALPPGMVPAPPMAEGDGVADTEITLLSPTELFFLGRKTGSMNVILQGPDGRCTVKDIVVTVDPATLQSEIVAAMPDAKDIRVTGAENTIVLSGSVRDAVQLDQVLTLASAYGDLRPVSNNGGPGGGGQQSRRPRIVNMLRVTSPQQVMLEVKIAEVSKTILDKLGANLTLSKTADGGMNTYSFLSNFLTNSNGLLQALRIGRASLSIDGQNDDGIVRVLAEPNIMAVSGQSASFLSGGKIFIPVSQTGGGTAFPVITLEEKEFGIGLKFTPTVLDGRVNLKLVSEVSDLSQTGSPFTTVNGVTSVLPSLTTRRVDTTVQLGDGQSFAIAGLIKNNFTEALKKFPGLGETPVVGALFRSTEFQKDMTELLFVVTPHLVKPVTGPIPLPTDVHVEPTPTDALMNGRGEGGPLLPPPNAQP